MTKQAWQESCWRLTRVIKYHLGDVRKWGTGSCVEGNHTSRVWLSNLAEQDSWQNWAMRRWIHKSKGQGLVVKRAPKSLSKVWLRRKSLSAPYPRQQVTKSHRRKKWKGKPLSHVQLFATPWTIWSLEFSRPESWSGYPFTSPGELPNPCSPSFTDLSLVGFYPTFTIFHWWASLEVKCLFWKCLLYSPQKTVSFLMARIMLSHLCFTGNARVASQQTFLNSSDFISLFLSTILNQGALWNISFAQLTDQYLGTTNQTASLPH